MQPRQVRRPASAEYQSRAVTTGAVELREVEDYIRAHVSARTAFGPIGECSVLCASTGSDHKTTGIAIDCLVAIKSLICCYNIIIT